LADGELDELLRALDALPAAALLIALGTLQIVAANQGATELLGTTTEELVGGNILTYIHPDDRQATTRVITAMSDGVIDGYQARRRIVAADGTDIAVAVWGRRVDPPNEFLGLWVLVPPNDPRSWTVALTMESGDVVLALTDHDWQIEYASADAGLVGAQASGLRGFPLLGLVRPSAAGEFLAAARRAAAERLAVTILTELRAAPDGWAIRSCLLVSMCEHTPPRLGVVISVPERRRGAAKPSTALDDKLRHAALEARAVQTLQALPALARLPGASDLSARQIEIVARLVSGERVSDIAAAMYLSPATIRNHLSAIYRKFGVHSQAELLAALLRSATPRGT
jgi:PAS domain S-box-containing protein